MSGISVVRFIMSLVRTFFVLLISTLLCGCATSFWDKNHYPHLDTIELGESANSWAQNLKRMQNYAKSYAKDASYKGSPTEKKYGPSLNWSEDEILRRGEAIGVRSLQHTFIENGEFTHMSWNAPDVVNIFDRPANLQNYIKYAEYAVMGRANARKDNNMMFDVDVEHYLKGIPFVDSFVVTNREQGHIGLVKDDMSHQLKDGQLCVFFPSETYTKYRNAFPLDEFISRNEQLRFEVFPRMCQQDNGRFTFTQTGDGEKLLFKQDILYLAPPIVKDDKRPIGLPLTNSIEAINSWDILTVNGYRSPRPLASLTIARGTHHRDLKMICGPNLYGGQIIDGKYIGGWAYADGKIEHCKDRSNSVLGYHFSKNFQTGTFYGNRQTLYFDSPELNFIAKRADRGSQTGGWSDRYKMHDVEKCIIDHPRIGSENYGGYKLLYGEPVATLYLTQNGANYWEACKPNFRMEVKVVEHSLLFLITNTEEINSQLADIDPTSHIKAYLDENSHSIRLTVEPRWADSHRKALEHLKEGHPYLAVKEEVFDEIILTAR